jgi:hypothetical protein
MMAGLLNYFLPFFPMRLQKQMYAGPQGRVRLTSRYYTPSTTIEYFAGKQDSKQIIELNNKEEGFGYQHEAMHVGECLEKGLTESPVMTHADTLLVMEMLDAIRKRAGIIYSAD